MTNSLALVVDDVADNRELFERVLELAGYATSSAKNGQEALDILEKQTFQLMILDLDMPLVNGREVLQRLKLRSDKPVTHIIVATANAEMTTEIVSEMADFVIYKPISVKDLITMSKRLMPSVPAVES